jgi:CHAT domain-containing protein
MDPTVYEAIASLALRDVPRRSPSEVRAWRLASAPAISEHDGSLLDAVVELRSGALGTVPGLLAGDTTVLGEAIEAAARVGERNRFPGGRGAVLESDDLDWFVEPPWPDFADPIESTLTVAIGHVDAMVGNWRSISGGHGQGLQPALARVAQLQSVSDATACAWLLGYLQLVEADLRRLGSDGEGAQGAFARACSTFERSGDPAGSGACQVALGDWYAAPQSSPELLNLSIDSTPPTPGVIDVARAHECYDAARGVYGAGNLLGLAGVRLRDGYLAAARRDVDGWHAAASEAEAMAIEGDDRWLAVLAATHRALAAIRVGHVAPVDELAAAAGRAHEQGGRAWVRGLVRLAVAQSSAWRDAGELVAARRALQLAQGMAHVSSAPVEVAEINDRLVELYGSSSFPVPRAILELATISTALSNGAGLDDPIAWTQLGYRAESAMAMGSRAIDGEVLLATAPILERLVASQPKPAASSELEAAIQALSGLDPSEMPAASSGMDPLVAMSAMTALAASSLAAHFTSSAKQAQAIGALYAGRSARRDGLPDVAAEWEQRALDAAVGDDMAMLRAVVLGTIGRKDEALALVEQLRDRPDLAPYLPQLFARLGAYDRALGTLPESDPPSARPWDELALRAEVLAGVGRVSDAASVADTGIEAFELSLARFARDVLKSAATEDVAAADLYLTRILVDARAAEEGEPGALRRTFATSDRARSVSNLDPIADERGEAAVRRWLALGSQWAAAYEELGAMAASVADIDVDATRARLHEVERQLNDAEDELVRIKPELVAVSQTRRPVLDVDAVAGALPPDALLIQYHCWNDELLSWAMTTDEIRFHRQAIVGRDVASDARRFLRAASGSLPWEPALAGRLSELLLGPWTTELQEHGRVVLVPHGVLTSVPFHVLDLEGVQLAVDHIVSYSPSSSHLPRLVTGRAPEHASFVLGDPSYAPSRGLRNLPGSGVEARHAAQVLNSAWLLTEDDATGSNVRVGAPGCSLVHLGTHGLLDERSPNRSCLALAGDDSLSVSGLLELDVEGALIVLSACNSGRGRATAGGDVVGLIRALLASGAGAVIASMWPVDDEVGCLVMAHFYQHLAAGSGAAEALRGAAGDVRELSADDRHDAYAAIESRVGSRGRPAGARDAANRAGPSGVASDTAMWAPFVYVGR